MIVGRIICLKKQFFARKFSKSTKEAWDSFLRSSPRASLRRFLENHDDVANEILQNTEITRNHLTPELKLFLLTQNCSLYHKPVISEHEDGKFSSLTKNVFQDPYWSIYWPGGQALTRFIFDEREKILKTMSNSRKDTLRILDLGAGCGAAAIAAKLTIGTCEIIANDISRVYCFLELMKDEMKVELSLRAKFVGQEGGKRGRRCVQGITESFRTQFKAKIEREPESMA
nr:PREDICTED: protein N-lysine methyltransferase METTL20-like isoform X2 [Linepithema humile]